MLPLNLSWFGYRGTKPPPPWRPVHTSTPSNTSTRVSRAPHLVEECTSHLCSPNSLPAWSPIGVTKDTVVENRILRPADICI